MSALTNQQVRTLLANQRLGNLQLTRTQAAQPVENIPEHAPIYSVKLRLHAVKEYVALQEGFRKVASNREWTEVGNLVATSEMFSVLFGSSERAHHASRRSTGGELSFSRRRLTLPRRVGDAVRKVVGRTSSRRYGDDDSVATSAGCPPPLFNRAHRNFVNACSGGHRGGAATSLAERKVASRRGVGQLCPGVGEKGSQRGAAKVRRRAQTTCCTHPEWSREKPDVLRPLTREQRGTHYTRAVTSNGLLRLSGRSKRSDAGDMTSPDFNKLRLDAVCRVITTFAFCEDIGNVTRSTALEIHIAQMNTMDFTIWAALHNEVLRANGGKMRREWSGAGMQGRGKHEIHEETR
ncbi:hypothetical protein PR048_009930 [Dryococelus australis]|uniref:Uncharacterized protein n=1 Tax=Dryococelus australis TaxID=614101 RepID=A0ABQ9I1Q1_9NEOP|nr:hypothetical protein PR048_009930 [Dryococelus australis]